MAALPPPGASNVATVNAVIRVIPTPNAQIDGDSGKRARFTSFSVMQSTTSIAGVSQTWRRILFLWQGVRVCHSADDQCRFIGAIAPGVINALHHCCVTRLEQNLVRVRDQVDLA